MPSPTMPLQPPPAETETEPEQEPEPLRDTNGVTQQTPAGSLSSRRTDGGGSGAAEIQSTASSLSSASSPPSLPSSSFSSSSSDHANGLLPSDAECTAQTAQDDAVRAASASLASPADGPRHLGAAMTADGSMLHKHASVKRLPPGTKPVRLVGEGAANAVFEIKVPRSKASDGDFKGLLLRAAKVSRLGQPCKYNYILQQKFYATSIKPILGPYANHQELVILRDTDIVEQLNALLQDINHTRVPKFRDSYVGLSDWGLLTRDMRPRDSTHSLLVEFKPKWLAQSPSAPPGAIRCRQCALELYRLLSHPPPSKPPRPEKKPCPLALMDPDAPDPVASPFRIAPQLKGLPDEAYFEGVLRDICRDPLLQTLREQQILHDPEGPLHAQADDYAFGVAMTIRDCTCFVQIPRSRPQGGGDEPLTLRLADLDWKDAGTKLHTWRTTEQRLVEGGYYTAQWLVCNGLYYRPPSLCLLELAQRDDAQKDIIQLQNEEGNSADEHVFVQKVDTEAFEKILAPFKKEAPSRWV